MRTIFFSTLAILFCAASGSAQGTKPVCPSEIPAGTKIVRLPVSEQPKITVSDFNLSLTKDGASYDLTMRIKNGTDNWCLTSFAPPHSFGDARGQEWIANEYPVAKRFTTKPDPPSSPGQKSALRSSNHSVGLNPSQDEIRTLFDVYDYIQPRPLATFDGFHIISGEVRLSFGYTLDKSK